MINPNQEINHYQYSVDKEYKNNKIRDILINCGFSGRLISTIKREGKLLLNGEPVRFVDRAKKGDLIDVFLPEEKEWLKPIKGDFDIIYEDSEVLIDWNRCSSNQ